MALKERAFSRILELVLVLVILFALVTTVSKQSKNIPVIKEDLRILSRYANDISNMICNSKKDRKILLENLSMISMNESINYVTSPDLKYKVVIFNVSDNSIINSFGHPNPNGGSVITSSCILTKGNNKVEVEVMVWY